MKNVFLNVRTAKAQAEGCAKVTKSSRMAKVLTTLTLLLTLGVGQMWAMDVKKPKVYFNNQTPNWSTSNFYFAVGHGTYTRLYNTTTISNTKLQYVNLGAYDCSYCSCDCQQWGDATYVAFCRTTSAWDQAGSYGYGNIQKAQKYSGQKNSYNMNSGSTYYCYMANANNGATLSVDYKSSGYSDIPKFDATQSAKKRDTGTSYSTVSGTWPATLKLQGTYLSGDGTSSRSTITSTTSTEITHSYESLNSSYYFEGWGTGSTPSSTNTTYSYNISAATTVYAFFSKKYTLTYDKKGTYGTSTLTVAVSDFSGTKTSGSSIPTGHQITFTATPASGYVIEGWYSDAACTVSLENGQNTTYTISSLNANRSVYVKFEQLKTITIKFAHEATAGWVIQGVTKYPTSGGQSISADGTWVTMTFTNVYAVSNIDLAYAGGGEWDNLNTSTKITGDCCYNKDGSLNASCCVPRANPTWGTAPASGAIGGSMTATVSGAPDGATITWTSTNTSAATVNSSGVISYEAAGNTTIKARVQKAAGGDYCELDYTLSQDISVTSGATVTATRTCPAYVSSNSGQVKLDISSTGASTGWYYRVCNSTKTAYYAPDEQSAASNTLSWTMNGSLPTGSNTLVVELYNSARQLVRTSSSVTVNVEIAESVTISAGANGSVSPSGIVYANNNHVHPTITATPNEHYNFVNWTSSYPSSAWVASATSATTTVTATASGYTITANFAGDQYSIEYYDQGGSAFSGTQTNPPTTHTYGTATTLKTPTKTGFTFGGWYTNSACTGASVSSLGATAYTANINLYAKWTEVMSTLTTSCHYDAGDPSYAVPTKSVSSIGISTTSNLVATAPGTGYTFVGWTLTHCVRTSGAANSRTITVRSDGSGEAASAVANYEEVLTSTYYVEGDASGPFTYGWNANANTMMMKRTGYSTSSDVYWELEVPASKTSPGNNQWEFKIYNDASTTNEKWYGWGNGTVHHWLTKANNNLTLSTTGSNTIYLKCYVEGTYTFHVNYSTPASPTLEVIWPVVNQLRISSANPADAGNTGNYDLVEGSDNDWSVSRNLNAGTTYTFKMVYEGDWYGKNSTNLTRASNSASALSTDGANMTIETDVAGSYTFTFNSSSKNLTVTYPTAYTITYGVGTLAGCDAVTTSPSFTSGDYVLPETDVTFSKGSTNSGYTWKGWYSNVGGTGDAWSTSDASLSLTDTRTGNISVYACYNYATYTATLSTTGRTGYGSGAPANQTATYLQAMPTITPPTATNGYCFMGYWDGEEGTGTQYYNANGTSAHAWDKTSGATLYAYFKKAEITDITLNNTMFDPVAAGGTGFVIANPTIEPTPVLPVKICWELLYDNDNPVPAGHEAIDDHDGSHPNRVKFSSAGLAAGGYKIKATLRTGDDCSGGTLLSKREVSFTIASGYTVTIQYKDSEGNTIAPSTTSPGKATDWTSISAPTIVGYNFSTWVPGDGITLESSATTNSNRFKATFNGTLTARYTKKRVIYFNNTLGWSNVYVYFYSSNKYWADNYGTGAYAGKYFDGYKPYSDQRHGHMTQIEGTNIWYFDYTAAGYDTYENIAFANMDKSNSGTDNTSNNNLGFFSNTPSDPIQVVRRGDHNASLPMFVPLAGQPKTKLNNNKAEYSNQGYWMNYPENTGYALRLFNSSGVEIDSIPFEFTPDKTMPMSVEYILDGSKTYQFKLYRTDGKWFGNNGTMKAGASGDIGETSWEFKEKDGETTRNNCQIKTNAAGTYTFTLDFGNKDGYNYLIGVHYPAAEKDFQILYNDNAEWSLGSAHDANWVHPSRIIRARENGVDTISFFVAKDNAPILKARKVSSINASTGAITWGSLNINGAAKQDLTVDSSAVYNFKVTQGAAGVINSIQYIGAYTGNYYIRSSALSNKWGNYVDNLDHRMTYSSFSESAANSFGEKYSHYKAKWCPRNTNIAFCIANDYSPCITDTLIQDVGNPYNNTDTEGTLKNDGDAGHSGNNAYLDRYSANVRFMWDRKTNKISRAYVSASTSTNAKFLVLQGSGATNANIYDGSTGAAFTANPPGTNSVKLSDNENWIYEVTVKANPSALVKLYANYCGQTQWFRGAAGGFTEGTTAIQILGGSASASQYSVRVIYDFKTNRLIAAWVPSGSSETIDTDLIVNADVMIVREHQESAQCITFSNDAKMTSVKNVYGVMRFNRWILNNRQYPENQNKDEADLAHHPPLSVGQQKSTYERRLYFISFPFDVLVGDIFGFGTYGQYWVIQYYDGLNRAKKGYWMDSKPNWKYVSPTQVAQGYKLEKNQGYILELNLSAMAADNTTFWSNGISTIELYFPSTVNQEILKQTDITIPALGDEYECTINRGTTEGDRRVKDSYWRCIGVPSYNLYNSALKDGSGNTITWKTEYTWQEDESEFPFIYMWNKTDNTLTPQATSTFTFQPMHAYLTQIKSAIVWTAVSAKPSSIVARRASKEATKEYNWRIELKQDTTFLDQTYVRMTDLEQVTDSFDFGQDLIKELNSRSNIYTFIGYEKVAANSMTLHTDQTTVIPVGANITTEGDYTFAMPDGADGIGVTLIDAETGTRTNLSAGMDYTVYLEKGTHDNRFWLEISPVQQTPTDIEAVSGQPSEVRKVLIDGILYIVKDGKLFDARGKRVE